VNGKSNPILWCIFIPVLQTQSIGLFYKMHRFIARHGWIATPWLLWLSLDDLGFALLDVNYC
jgi:hypothetical protein